MEARELSTGISGTKTRRGSALIAALILISALAMLMLSMLAAGVEGSRAANGQDDGWRLTSAVESVGSLTAQHLWSGYLRSQGGASGDVGSFRTYLDSVGVANAGPGGSPPPDAGTDLLPVVPLPSGRAGASQMDRVRVENLHVLRRDEGDATRLFVSVEASTNRGGGAASPLPARALQVVYSVEPAPFDGFDYAILTKNANCVFCHAVIDSAKRAYDTDPTHYGTFAKVKVGTLESLMLRSNGHGNIDDFSADTLLAGTLYVRGKPTDQHGVLLRPGDWSSHTAQSCAFDADGHLAQDGAGLLTPEHFDPADMPLQPGENLYVDYPTDYAAQPDGLLPNAFPPPFPDDGGIDPVTGRPSSVGAGNKRVDPGEFLAIANEAEGHIVSGVVYYSAPGQTIATQAQYNRALTVGNRTTTPRLDPVTTGNVVLSGTLANPLVIEGTVAIDGDVVIQGWIKGKGSIVASGNVFVPGDLHYLDGQAYLPNDPPGHPSGPTTFGVAQDGTQNTLGLASGGNIMIGDYLRPSPTFNPGQYDIVSGDASGTWNFALAEISLFNRTEWAHTQPMLPGPNDDPRNPATWRVVNPGYLGADYIPRYYQFGPGDQIPIFNLGRLYFDPSTGTWLGGDVPVTWNQNLLTIVDPADHSNPLLYDPATGAPRAAVLQITSENGWLPDSFQKRAIENFKAARPAGAPMRLDGLFYTNNAIFGIVYRNERMNGKLVVNGSLVCADLGLLATGKSVPNGADNVPGSPYSVGLRLNYDERTKGMLNVRNPLQVIIRRALWRPTATL